MSRKLHRVPLSFDWPLNQRWQGYVNPFYARQVACSACGGTGYDPVSKQLHDQWYGHAHFDPASTGSQPFTPETPPIRALAESNVLKHWKGFPSSASSKRVWELSVLQECERLLDFMNPMWSHHLSQEDVDALVKDGQLMEFTRRPRTPEQAEALRLQAEQGGSSYWLKESNGYHPTAQEVNLWSIGGMGHDGINAYVCIRARAKRMGVSKKDQRCRRCKGEGHYYPNPADKRRAARWKSFDPPEGEGYQLWETTSEGSPVSPVFASLDELCAWCEDNATTFASQKVDRWAWRKMLDDDFVYHQEGNSVFL